MRKFNGLLTAGILVLFLIHGIGGAFQLFGAGNVINRILAWVLAALILIHTVIGIVLTVQSIRIQKKAGAYYFRQNTLFWARRISGFAIFVFILFHATAFSDRTAAVYRLVPFNTARLVVSILLVVSIAVHVISNVRPMLITFGIPGLKGKSADILLILAVILLFMGAAFIVYYLRWMRI